MILWMSSELMADVTDAYRACRKAIEAKVNELLSQEKLLPKFEKWAFIAIIRDTDNSAYDEVIKKSGKGRVLEFRLKIPYEQFKNGSDTERMDLVFEALFRTAENMEELGVPTEDRRMLANLLTDARQQLTIS